MCRVAALQAFATLAAVAQKLHAPRAKQDQLKELQRLEKQVLGQLGQFLRRGDARLTSQLNILQE